MGGTRCWLKVLVFIFQLGISGWVIGAETSQPASTALWLSVDEPVGVAENRPLLQRELIRQAILIAAREEIGAATRDQLLEDRPGPVPDGAIQLDVRILAGSPAHVSILRKGVAGELIWSGDLAGVDWNDRTCLNLLAESAEKLSRGPWVEAIRKAGINAQTVPKDATPPMRPRQIDRWLNQVNELSQFAGVRAAHDLYRRDPSSSEALGCLIRGYANLGELTAYQWTAMHKGFAARSLLYAHRMVQANPKSQRALFYRAYARALAGLQEMALADLDAAQHLPADPNLPELDWIPTIDAYCHFNVDRLTKMAAERPSAAPLAMFLAFLSVEHCGSQGALMTVARAALEADPDCLRLIDSMCSLTGPGMLNQLVEAAPMVFSRTMGKELDTMPGMPPSLVQLIRNQKNAPAGRPGRIAVCEAMEALPLDSDIGEPPLSTLSAMIRETTFIHVFRRASLISEAWGIDASDFVAQSRPLIERHRYRGLIESYGLLHDSRPGAWAEPLRSVQIVDLEMSAMPLIRYLAAADPERQKAAPPISAWPSLHSDGTTGDCERIIAAYSGHVSLIVASAAELLRRVSPGNPLAIAVAIENNWDKVQDQAAAWEKDHGTHPAVARELARRYTALSRWADAERCWKQYIDIAQDQQGYYGLANVRLAQGDRAGWLKAMTDFLNQEDYGLQHANAQVAIADWYASQSKYAEAQPYAEAAAQTRAQWAMMCAARIAEGLQQWDKSEAWVREAAEHYNQPLNYFEWCVRTGHGDRDGARDAARPAAEAFANRADRESQVAAATFYVETGENKKAEAVLSSMCVQTGDPWAGLVLAVLSQEAGETAARDLALSSVIDKGPKTNAGYDSPRLELVELAKLFKTAWVTNAPLDLDACGKLAAAAGKIHRPSEASNVQSLVGKFLLLGGKKDEAAKWFGLSAAGEEDSTLKTLAIVELRKSGHDPIKKAE